MNLASTDNQVYRTLMSNKALLRSHPRAANVLKGLMERGFSFSKILLPPVMCVMVPAAGVKLPASSRRFPWHPDKVMGPSTTLVPSHTSRERNIIPFPKTKFFMWYFHVISESVWRAKAGYT